MSLTAHYCGAYSYDTDNGPPYYAGKGITDYDWDMGDETFLDGSSVVHEYSEPREYGVELTVWDDEPDPCRMCDKHTITVWVVTVDVEAGLSGEEKQNPGLHVNVNWSDDDEDGWTPNDSPPNGTYKPDKLDDFIGGGGDDDFRSFGIDVDPNHAPVTVVVEFENNIKVWESWTKKKWEGEEYKSSEVASGTAYDPDEMPYPLLIEGQSGTEDFRDVSLTATVKYGQDEICSDVVKITVFEVTVTPLFARAQQGDCEKKFSDPLFKVSSDRNGRISWDDANGDGVVGDYDEKCKYFANCMECQGSIKPVGVLPGEVVFDLTRDAWGRAWNRWATGSWSLFQERIPWDPDDTTQADEDLTPSNQNHIYMIDGPVCKSRKKSECGDYVLWIANFKEWALVSIGGQMRQCSDIQKWHHQLYLKPKGSTEFLTRHDAALQKLGGGWVNVPNNP